MYELCYGYVKPEDEEKAGLCYIDADSSIVHLKTDYIYKNMQKMLKQDLTLQTLNQMYHYRMSRTNK